MNRQVFIGIVLVQAIVYTVLWMINDYSALLISLGVAMIVFVIMMISWISDRLEYANVGKWYYPILWISFIIPLSITLLFWVFKSGDMDWMHSPFGK